jgi:hypothetical protein
LDNAGLLTCRREGRSLWYTVSFSEVRGLLAYLTEDCCQGRSELCGPGFSGCATDETNE